MLEKSNTTQLTAIHTLETSSSLAKVSVETVRICMALQIISTINGDVEIVQESRQTCSELTFEAKSTPTHRTLQNFCWLSLRTHIQLETNSILVILTEFLPVVSPSSCPNEGLLLKMFHV